MDATTLQAAIAIGMQLTQAALDWQAKMAAGTVTDADIDAKLVDVGMSRADLQVSIDRAKAEGR